MILLFLPNIVITYTYLILLCSFIGYRLNYDHSLEYMEPVQPPIMMGCYSKIPKDQKKMKDGEGDLYAGGVTCLLLLPNDKIAVGAGDGTVELIAIVGTPVKSSGKTVKLPSTPQIRTVSAFCYISRQLFAI